MEALNIKNAKGRPFNVVIIRKGEAYGRDNDLINDDGYDLVEFYDATYAGGKFGELGQFVTRYRCETLINGNSRNTGLSLMGYEPLWTLYRPEMALVVAWLENQLTA